MHIRESIQGALMLYVLLCNAIGNDDVNPVLLHLWQILLDTSSLNAKTFKIIYCKRVILECVYYYIQVYAVCQV